MYLSELFLECIGTDYTQASILEAMHWCEEEYLRRKLPVTKEELMDFYYVVKEFREVKVSRYQVLQDMKFRQKGVA